MEGVAEASAKSSNSADQSKEDWEEWMKWDDPADVAAPVSQTWVSLAAKQTPPGSKKRKSMSDDDHDVESSNNVGKRKPLPGPRSHNIVERRYRTNINQRIAALRDSIPSLRAAKETEPDPGPFREPIIHKLNKATVLSTAVDYIQNLEKDKRRLEDEISQLRARLRVAQEPAKIVEEPDNNVNVESNASSPDGSQVSTCTSTGSSTFSNPAKGMIEVPEDIRRLRTTSSQAQNTETSYLERCDALKEQTTVFMDKRGAKRARMMGKLMVGSFAGLMIVQGFSGNEVTEKNVRKRSLSALPRSTLWSDHQILSVQQRSAYPLVRPQMLLAMLKIFVALFILGFGVFLYAFCSKPKSRNQPHKTGSIPSLTSPVELRRNAWLTAIQTLRVPRHEMFPEWAAVNIEALQYVLRHIIGWRAYSRLTGRSEDDEIARVRAWDIAIDAQLMGGDAEISGSRLILSILASGTLPRTPARLIIKATHLRILLWKASKPGRGSLWSIMHKIAAALAEHQWRLAQESQRKTVLHEYQDPSEVENLPEHLATLLQLSCNEVLTSPIIQRAYNLAWSRPTREDVHGTDYDMDLVVEDSTIRSPHDALCGWVSSTTLQKCLFAKLSNLEDDSCELEWSFGVALHTAPPASIAQARALAANAVFVAANHQGALSVLLQDFMPKEESGSKGSMPVQPHNTTFVDSSLPKAVCYDVALVVYCALAAEALTKFQEDPQDLMQALHTVSLVYRDAKELTWLSFSSAYYLLHVIQLIGQLHNIDMQEIHWISSRLLFWFQDMEGPESAIEKDIKVSIERALKQYPSSKDELDLVSSTGDASDPNIKHEASKRSDSGRSCGEQTALVATTNTSVSNSPLLVTLESEIRSYKVQDRRVSLCSVDSGYGSVGI